MNLSDLSIKRPIFITCVFILTLIVGGLSFSKLGVDLFPNVNFPIVMVTTTYPGAGPAEIESLVTRPVEDTVGTVPGVKTVRSTNTEGASLVIVEFTLDTDSKYAEQQIKDRVTTIRSKLPDDADDPIVRAFDPADQPILTIAIKADLPQADLFDLADVEIRPLIEQVRDVGFVEVLGGRKREIHVLLDREKLVRKNISASMVVNALKASGMNIPAGKATQNNRESIVRTLGDYDSLKKVENTIVTFYGNEVPVRVGDVGKVQESLEDEKSRSFINGSRALTMTVFRRSGANTIAVADAVKKRVEKINHDYASRVKGFGFNVVQDGAKPIRANVDDVTESIVLGILLTIIVVYFFLGSARSTLITGIALPNSLLGAFILMAIAGFSLNIMTLLAMSLAVGLLIDDAIVVRENIFRYIENGKTPMEAASQGTKEVTLAVIATTLTVVAVFGPVAFLSGVVGQFFKEFGLTICFIMAISLLDALTMAPMLSAYFAGDLHAPRKNFLSKFMGKILDAFNRTQDRLADWYAGLLKHVLARPMSTLAVALVIFVGSFWALKYAPKTFIPPQDSGEFQVTYETEVGTDLEGTSRTAEKMDQTIRNNPEVQTTVLTVGGRNGETNLGDIFVQLVPSKERKQNTTAMKETIRKQLIQDFAANKPKVMDRSAAGGGSSQQPLMLNLMGSDIQALKKVADQIYDKLKDSTDIQDLDINYREGRPEYQVSIDKEKADYFGVTTSGVGQELRTQIEGTQSAVYRRNGNEYDIRVRLDEEQRDIRSNYGKVLIPNINNRLIRLSDVAKPAEALGPSVIYREDRGRYVQLSAALNPTGKGLGGAIASIRQLFDQKQIELPPGVSYKFVGQAENFQELVINILVAAMLSVLFIYLVLSSLYESFITPFTIMLVLPLAMCGAFYAIAITGVSLDMFSMIGCIMLLGVATKNSILLVDYTNQLMAEGKAMKDAIIEAGRVRLRPILMTSVALIAGMLPVAIGLNEASKQRTSMGIAVIGGLISSTLLTLVVIPAAYSYIERFRNWSGRKLSGKAATAKAAPHRKEDKELPRKEAPHDVNA